MMNMGVNKSQASSAEEPLTCQKGLFSLPEGVHYLNCAYMSPLTKAVEGAGIQGIRRKSIPLGVTSADFFHEVERAKTLFAELVNAPAGRVAIIPAASYGVATVAKNLNARAGQSVVVLHEQFPSNVYAWRKLLASGVELRTVAPPAGAVRGAQWNERLLEVIDETTVLVALEHVHWTDGTLFDLAAIGARAREVGAALVVDGTQSVGALPFDVESLQPDALIVAGYKSLMGPYGIGFAYYGERFDNGSPLEETWIGRQGSEDFSGLVRYRDDYAEGAVRYDMGERSNFILLPMMITALEHLLNWQPARVQAYCQTLMQPALAELRAAGYRLEDDSQRAHHLFGLRLPADQDLSELVTRLEAEHVFVSVRGDAVRVSPNVYNNEADAAALLRALLSPQ